MQTNEERKKIAENLKSFANGKTGVLDGVVDGLLGLRHDCRGSDRFTSESVLRLAGIIEDERTCRPLEKFHEDSPYPYLVCSECAEPLNYRENNGDYELLPYCAGCGAKVVE